MLIQTKEIQVSESKECGHPYDKTILDLVKVEGDVYYYQVICGVCGAILREYSINAGRTWEK